MIKYSPTKTQRDLEARINWEYVHAHHPIESGPITDGPWFERIMAHARRNGFNGKISTKSALETVNSNLY